MSKQSTIDGHWQLQHPIQPVARLIKFSQKIITVSFECHIVCCSAIIYVCFFFTVYGCFHATEAWVTGTAHIHTYIHSSTHMHMYTHTDMHEDALKDTSITLQTEERKRGVLESVNSGLISDSQFHKVRLSCLCDSHFPSEKWVFEQVSTFLKG